MRSWVRARRGLYAIVDPAHCGARSPIEVASGILEGGCAALQLRSKSMPDRPLLALAERLRGLARDAGVPFVLNDRPDIAKLVEADGLHLGQDDLSVAAARAIVGPEMAIGLSTHDLDQVGRAADEGADYLGFGPVYPTTSKANPDPVVAVAGLKAAVEHARIPVVAIGGITASRVSEVAATGARYWAAISALCAATDVAAAARRMQETAS
jgi:thiamine-phosphate pyrophosphorylase